MMRSTSDIIDEIVERLGALTWETEPAFGVVAKYDANRLPEAFSDLLVAQHARVAFVVWTGERWDLVDRRPMRTTEVSLIVSDRVLGHREDVAMWGDFDHPGAIQLKELVIPALTGRLIANPDGIESFPIRVTNIVVQDQERQSAACVGRMAVTIDFECRGGTIEPDVQRGPVR